MEHRLIDWDSEGIAHWADVAPSNGAVLAVVLRGFVDAGHAGQQAADHILGLSEPTRIGTFDIDALLDYRSRRPEMTFSVNEWTDYDEPSLALNMVHDANGTPFLMLSGFEPDLQWERFALAAKEVVDRFGIGLTVGANGLPMAVPHTRDLTATVHGTDQSLLPDVPTVFGTVNVPASAQALMSYRFGQWGLPAVTVAVHVPHYLAQTEYPQAAQRALTGIEDLTGLDLDVTGLDEEAESVGAEIDRQTRASDEVRAVVEQLEEQYDAFTEAREDATIDGPLPSADEIGAEFERFLRQQRSD